MERFGRSLYQRGFGLRDQPGLPPEIARDDEGINPGGVPPAPLIADPVQRAVVAAAERHHEFVADLAATSTSSRISR